MIVSYTVTLSPVTLTLMGTTPDANGDGNLNILVGQGCVGIINGIPPALQPYTTYKWTVTGTTFQSWSPTTPAFPNANPPTLANPNASYEVDSPIPAVNFTTWFWNDLSPDPTPETVTCTATVTPPMGQGGKFSVIATQKVTVYVPSWGAVGIGGYMQVNKSNPKDPTHYNLWAGPTTFEATKTEGSLPGGMNWQATVTTPTSPAFGTGKLELVQLVSPKNSYTTVAKPTVTVTDPENKNLLSLDLNYPYGGDVALEVAGSTSPIYKDNDSPRSQLDGTNVLATANKSGSYTDYLMYMPPVAVNSTSTWVLLGTFGWSTNGSAAMPGN